MANIYDCLGIDCAWCAEINCPRERGKMTEKLQKENKPTITAKEFVKRNKKEDLCFDLEDGILTDDIEERVSIDAEYISSEEDYKSALKRVSHIKVYKKERYKLTPAFLFEQITDDLNDKFGFDTYDSGTIEDHVGADFFDKICKKFNKEFSYYTSDEHVCYLDLSKALKDYCEDYLKDEITRGE